MKLMEIREINSYIYKANIDISEVNIKIDSVSDLSKSPKFKSYKPNCHLQGALYLDHSDITSLEGSPISITGDFDIASTNIKNLVGGPETVGGYYRLNYSTVESLKGIAKEIKLSLQIKGCTDLKNIKDLWNCQVSKIIYDDTTTNPNMSEIYEAVELMMKYKLAGSKNYMEVMKAAREKGLESYF